MSDRSHLCDAYIVAGSSPDPSTQNGALIITLDEAVSYGWNGPTRGLVMGAVDWDRPNKYALVEHAERNAIYMAAARGYRLNGATMYACWAACADCARAIVQSGIARLVRHKRPGIHWTDSIAVGDRIMRDGGVEIVEVEGPIPYAPPVRFNGELWDPSAAPARPRHVPADDCFLRGCTTPPCRRPTAFVTYNL